MEDLMRHLRMPERPVKLEPSADSMADQADAFLDSARDLLSPTLKSTQQGAGASNHLPLSAAATLERQLPKQPAPSTQYKQPTPDTQRDRPTTGLQDATGSTQIETTRTPQDASEDVRPERLGLVRSEQSQAQHDGKASISSGPVATRASDDSRPGGGQGETMQVSVQNRMELCKFDGTCAKANCSCTKAKQNPPKAPKAPKPVQNDIMNLNNAAQAKRYRIVYDIYQKTNTSEYYGSVYIGSNKSELHPHANKAKTYDPREMKLQLARLGMKRLETLPTGTPGNGGGLEFKMTLPPNTPHGTRRVAVPKGTGVGSDQGPGFQKPVPAEIASPKEPAPNQASTDSVLDGKDYNWAAVLEDWANSRDAKHRLDFRSNQEPSTVLKHFKDRRWTAFVSLSEFNMMTFGSGKKYLPSEQQAKAIAAKKAIEWLVQRGHLKLEAFEAHNMARKRRLSPVRGPSSRPRSEERAAKRVHTDVRSRHGSPEGSYSREQYGRQRERDTERDRRQPLIKPGTDSRPVAQAVMSNDGQPAGGSLAIARLSPTPKPPNDSDASLEEYVDKVADLATLLDLSQPIVYYMPADPVRRPNSIFNGSVHFPGLTVDGTNGGAVVQIKELSVSGPDDAKRLLYKKTFEWLQPQQDQRVKALEAKLRKLRQYTAYEDKDRGDDKL